MIPALWRFSLVLVSSCLCATLVFSQSPARQLPTNADAFHFANNAAADPVSEELKSLGEQGQLIEQARAEVLSILTAENPCSAWYRSAEPEAVDKFRSLRFSLDSEGAGDITTLAAWTDDGRYYQPYVARTRQNVSWGSTITVNANGAFFKYTAPVRVSSGANNLGPIKSFRQLVVGRYSGGSLQARMLTLLHEYGHVLDMLPVDAGVPSGPLLSTQNTDTVLRHCAPLIQAQAKLSRKKPAEYFPAQASLALQSMPSQVVGLRQERSALYVTRAGVGLPPRFE